MSDIEVEAVDSLETAPAPDTPEYVLYGGKGGVGKTTMAAATGLASAGEDVATLVVSTDPAHSLSDTLDYDVPARPERVREDRPLFAAEIDPDDALAETGLFEEGGGLGAGLEGLLGEESLSMPGADEAAAMQQLLAYMDDDRFERVVIDTAPTGHTLRLLELPEAMDSLVGRLVGLRESISGMADSIPGFGDGEGGESESLEVLAERIERLRTTLRDPTRTDFRIVLVPESMGVAEARRLRERLDAFDIPVGTVVVNRVMEDFTDVTGADADFVSPDLEDCAFCQRRWNVQQDALAEAQELFRGHEVKRVPLFADEVRGQEMLRVVAACLA